MSFRSPGRSRQFDLAARSASYKAEQVRLKEAAAERRAASAARAKAAEDRSKKPAPDDQG